MTLHALILPCNAHKMIQAGWATGAWVGALYRGFLWLGWKGKNVCELGVE